MWMAMGVPTLAFACSAAGGEDDVTVRDETDVDRQAMCGQGYWQCGVSWAASTTQRMIQGATDFECACGYEPLHTCGNSWVDIVGGISQTCNDHSSTFFGPIDGEWNGCQGFSGTQTSVSPRVIESVNQNWDRWPTLWHNGTYYGDLSWLTSSDSMRGPFATVYDLDYCWNKQLINTLFWPNFPVTAQVIAGDPSAASSNPYAYASATWSLHGSTGLLCSDQDGVLADSGEFSGPKRPPVCADLIVDGTFHCQYYPAGECSPTPDPEPGPGPYPYPELPLMY
jgi:hypothetical protein